MLRNVPKGIVAVAAVVLTLSACGGGTGGGSAPAMSGALPATQSNAAAQSMMRADTPDSPSMLAPMTTETTIGSVADPVTGDQNPYGLDVSPATIGGINQGDFVVCDFNDKANVQGTGNSIVALAPAPGSYPRHITSRKDLRGCMENVQTSNGDIWTAAFTAADLAETSPMNVIDALSGSPFTAPFGLTLAQNAGSSNGEETILYEGDAKSGDLVRVSITPWSTTSQVIATGFPVNNGVAGSVLGPSGLQYEASRDRLYVVDGASNTIVYLNSISTIPAYGVTIGSSGTTFGGPYASDGHLVYSGSPLNWPISSALMPGGNLVVGNTGNAKGNLMIEVTPHGKIVSVRNVDKGTGGAIFGMVVVTNGDGQTNLYFNDDNSNTIVELSKP